MHDQGGHVTYLDSAGSHIGKTESLKDTARVLGRLFDGIEYRGFHQSAVEELAKFSHVPIWNGLTDESHPTQILADLFTMEEFGEKPLHDLSFCYLGDARFNMGCSLLVGGTKMGMDVRIAAPPELQPPADLLAEMRTLSTGFAKSGRAREIIDCVNAGRQPSSNFSDALKTMEVAERILAMALLGV